MPQNKFEEIIKNNNELLNLKKALEELEMEAEPPSKVWFLKNPSKSDSIQQFPF